MVASYNDVRKVKKADGSTAVTVGSAAPVKLFDTQNGMVGWRVFNPDGTNNLMIKIVRPGEPDPVAADFTTNFDIDYFIPAHKTQDDGLRGVSVKGSACAVWAMFDAGAGASIYPRTLWGPIR